MNECMECIKKMILVATREVIVSSSTMFDLITNHVYLHSCFRSTIEGTEKLKKVIW